MKPKLKRLDVFLLVVYLVIMEVMTGIYVTNKQYTYETNEDIATAIRWQKEEGQAAKNGSQGPGFGEWRTQQATPCPASCTSCHNKPPEGQRPSSQDVEANKWTIEATQELPQTSRGVSGVAFACAQ